MDTLLRHSFKKVLFIWLLCFGLVAVFSLSDAEQKYKKKNMKQSLQESDFVFRGRVKSVEYRKADDGIPHSFVTYEVQEAFRGQVQSRKTEITLRFIGGPIGNGTFLAVSGVPNFNPGDQDILFVQGNGILECPLVNCEEGRFRIKDGGVFSSRGRPIAGVKNGKVQKHGKADQRLAEIRYPAPSFDALLQRPEVQEKMRKSGKSKAQLRQMYEKDGPKWVVLQQASHAEGGQVDASQDADAKRKAQEPRTRPMKLQGFVNEIKKNKSGLKAPPRAAASLDPNKRFKGRPPSAGSAKGDQHLKLKNPQVQPLTAQDKAEFEALKRQNFNPVLKKK